MPKRPTYIFNFTYDEIPLKTTASARKRQTWMKSKFVRLWSLSLFLFLFLFAYLSLFIASSFSIFARFRALQRNQPPPDNNEIHKSVRTRAAPPAAAPRPHPKLEEGQQYQLYGVAILTKLLLFPLSDAFSSFASLTRLSYLLEANDVVAVQPLDIFAAFCEPAILSFYLSLDISISLSISRPLNQLHEE